MNVLENIPHNDEIALKPGQSVPRHNANSNVHLLVVRGSLTVNLDGADNQVKEGDLLAVAYQTPMIIKNIGIDNATFLVLKTPNPSEM
jgi:quercetin dioxygenase-like cupin family protein